MKKLLLFLSFCLIVYACKKNPAPKSSEGAIKFNLVGLRDTVMQQSDTLEIPFELQYTGGDKQVVAILPSEQLNNMVITVSNVQDTPSFATTLRIVTFNADTGTYTVKLRSTSGSQANPVTKDYSFTLKVVPNPVNPASVLFGDYTETGACSGAGSINHLVKVSEVQPYFNRINIKGLWSGGNFYNVQADINPTNQTVVVFPQQVNGVAFSGTGTYNTNQITLNYTVTIDSFADNCTTVLNK